MSQLIEPKILKGTRDFLPEEMAKRNFVEEKITEVFRLFGYDQIDTPAIEYAETLLGKYGEESTKLIYSFSDNGGRKVALRYDQTVPMARVVAANYSDLPMPFKRYQVSKVWRADKPAKGRYREFTQCDIDTIGTKSLIAEAEIAKTIYLVFKKLGLGNVLIKINSRRLINSILNSFGVAAEQQTSIIRILDKIEKIGVTEVQKELSNIISSETATNLLRVMLPPGSNSEKVAKLKKYDTAEIENFLKLCRLFDLRDENIYFDPSLARGLDYYTGVIYEVYIKDVDIGAVCAGGRYDNLCGLFIAKELSGVGVAFGFDRIILAMETKGLFKDTRLSSEVLVANFGETTLTSSLKIVSDLQKAEINTEIYFEAAKMEKQFKYAAKKKIPFVVMCGPDELRDEAITIKNMNTGKQKTIPPSQLVLYFKDNTAI